MPSYSVLLKYGPEGVWVDSALDVSAAITDAPYKDWIAAAKVFDRMTGDDVAVREQTKVLRDAFLLDLRTRFDGACDGPYTLHCPKEMTCEEITKHLRANPEVVTQLRKGRTKK